MKIKFAITATLANGENPIMSSEIELAGLPARDGESSQLVLERLALLELQIGSGD
jgi:hypothetical protein